MKLGTRDFKAKPGRDSEFKVCAGDGMPKITFGVTDPWVYRSGLQGLIGDPLISHLKLLTINAVEPLLTNSNYHVPFPLDFTR